MSDRLRVRVHQWASGLDPDDNRARLAEVARLSLDAGNVRIAALALKGIEALDEKPEGFDAMTARLSQLGS